MKFSESHIQALRDSHKGQKAWNKDKKGTFKHTDEFKEDRKKRWEGKNNPNFGKFGKEHPVWREDKKCPLDKLVRDLFKYRQWRSDIFTRDDFTCVLCGIRGVYLEADHCPKRFADILDEYKIKTTEEALDCEELWNINNGRTLCKFCHNKTRGRNKKS